MIQPLPSLTALRAFEAVCRSGSVKLAAAELNVTPGAVSRQIGSLADELGTKLFSRNGNSLRLTPDGTRLRDAVTRGFGLIQREAEALTNRRDSAPIALGCSLAFAMHWLLPRMHRLHQACPRLSVHIVPMPYGYQRADPGTMDAWIDQGRWPADATTLRAPFRHNVSTLAMSADFSRRHGPFHRPEDLQKLTLLPNSQRPEALGDWLRDEEYTSQEDKTMRPHFFDDLFLVLQSVRLGLGYALAPEAYIEDELADGRLVAPFGSKRRKVPFYIAWTRPSDSERLAPLIHWLEVEGQWQTENARVCLQTPEIHQPCHSERSESTSASETRAGPVDPSLRSG